MSVASLLTAGAAALLGSGVAPSAGSLCRVDFGNSTFDLSPLSIPSFYGVQDSRNNQGSLNYTYFFNLCANVNYLNLASCNTTYPGTGGPIVPGTWTPSPAFQLANIPVVNEQYDRCHRLGGPVSPSTVSYGLYDASNPSKGLYIQYTGGDICPGTVNVSRSLKVWLLCYDDATNIPDSEVVLESENPPCQYEIFLKSAFGCPIQCPLPAGTAGQRSLCSNHGVCDYDAELGSSRCFCNQGYGEGDCSVPVDENAGKGLGTAGAVLIGVSVLLALTLGFLGYLWFFKISRLRLVTTAYKTLAAGPTASVDADTGIAQGGRLQ